MITVNARRGLAFVDLNIAVMTTVTILTLTNVATNLINTCS